MLCQIFRSSRKADTYLYLRDDCAFADIPPALQKAFGAPVFAMSLNLSANRPLAREDVQQVIGNLARQGYHLQLPPAVETL